MESQQSKYNTDPEEITLYSLLNIDKTADKATIVRKTKLN